MHYLGTFLEPTHSFFIWKVFLQSIIRIRKDRSGEIYLTPRCRKMSVFLLESMDCLEAHMKVCWTIKLSKVCHQELWLSHRRRKRFLHGQKGSWKMHFNAAVLDNWGKIWH